MPQPRKYADGAERQRAYRDRLKSQGLAVMRQGAPGYGKWRKQLSEAYTLLECVYDELGEWMEDRSERWRESDRAGELEADRDTLYEILDKIDELSLRERATA